MINSLPRNWSNILGDTNALILNNTTRRLPFVISDIIKSHQRVLVVINYPLNFYTKRYDNVNMCLYEKESDMYDVFKNIEELKPELVIFDNCINKKGQKLSLCNDIVAKYKCKVLMMFQLMAVTTERDLLPETSVCLVPMTQVMHRSFPHAIPVYLYNDNEHFERDL